jgi:hypothetical protein
MPLDFSRFVELGKAARQTVDAGYERWLAAEDSLEEFILTPSSEVYQGFYQHAPLLQGMPPAVVLSPPPSTLRQRIRNLTIMRKAEWLWLPVWRCVKSLYFFFQGYKAS